LGSSVGGSVGSNLGDKVSEKVDEAGGPGGILADTVKNALPFGGGGGGGNKGGGLGVGKGRRMPVQQSIDIGLPIETVYNQWTQFEDWPTFMHRVVRVTQDEDNQVTFEAKIWTRKREFTAEIETQRPDDRIKWKVSSGMTHAGVVTFHELGPHLTRVLLSIDVQPGGMIEKIARGARHVKRAARGDLHRFKAFIEMAEQESGAWRGVIEEGEVVEEHDPSYDESREYSDPEEVMKDLEPEDEESDEDDEAKSEGDDDAKSEEEDDSGAEAEEEEEEKPRARARRRRSTNGHGADDEGSSRSSGSRSASRSSSSRASSGGGSGRSRSRSSGNGSGSSGSGRSSGSSRSSGGSRRSSSGSGSSSGGSSSGRRTRSRSSDN
jgi:Polyketide cyclase / dehydrase and lipid transport